MIKHRFGCAIGVALVMSALPSNAQEIESNTSMSGECKVELNAQDVGCDGHAVYSKLKNGRKLINFTGREIATVGFAGGQMVDTPAADGKNVVRSSVLWLDRIYVNQKPTDADGQCTFTIAESNTQSVKVECRALMRDTRKSVAVMQSTSTDTLVFGGETPVKIVGFPANKSPAIDKCPLITRTHGFLTRAQFQCGFRYYSSEMPTAARNCARSLSDAETKEALSQGMADFDSNEMERGHARLCRDVLRDFSNFLRK